MAYSLVRLLQSTRVNYKTTCSFVKFLPEIIHPHVDLSIDLQITIRGLGSAKNEAQEPEDESFSHGCPST